MIEAEKSVICGFMPQVGWTHNPLKPWEWPGGSNDEGVTWSAHTASNWLVTVVRRPDDSLRCNAVHPDDPQSTEGACGGTILHEHPHTWLRYGFNLNSIQMVAPKEALVVTTIPELV